MTSRRAESVVLLHGILRTHRNMARLARALEDDGYHTLNISYPSTSLPLETLAEHLHARVEEQARLAAGPLHFVGFSMGSLLIRTYIARFRPDRLGRVVMIGPPNKGSGYADRLQHLPPFRWLYGPAGQQLITDQRAFDFLAAPVDYELGIIAGNRSIDPLARFFLKAPHDGKVEVTHTMLDGMKEHKVLPVAHTLMPTDRHVIDAARRFLNTGTFQ